MSPQLLSLWRESSGSHLAGTLKRTQSILRIGLYQSLSRTHHSNSSGVIDITIFVSGKTPKRIGVTIVDKNMAKYDQMGPNLPASATESGEFIERPVHPPGEDAFLLLGKCRRFVLPVTSEFRSGINPTPWQSLSLIWRQVSRPTVLAGLPLASLERGIVTGPPDFSGVQMAMMKGTVALVTGIITELQRESTTPAWAGRCLAR